MLAAKVCGWDFGGVMATIVDIEKLIGEDEAFPFAGGVLFWGVVCI